MEGGLTQEGKTPTINTHIDQRAAVCFQVTLRGGGADERIHRSSGGPDETPEESWNSPRRYGARLARFPASRVGS